MLHAIRDIDGRPFPIRISGKGNPDRAGFIFYFHHAAIHHGIVSVSFSQWETMADIRVLIPIVKFDRQESNKYTLESRIEKIRAFNSDSSS
jgi:hypothetical protein